MEILYCCNYSVSSSIILGIGSILTGLEVLLDLSFYRHNIKIVHFVSFCKTLDSTVTTTPQVTKRNKTEPLHCLNEHSFWKGALRFLLQSINSLVYKGTYTTTCPSQGIKEGQPVKHWILDQQSCL